MKLYYVYYADDGRRGAVSPYSAVTPYSGPHLDLEKAEVDAYDIGGIVVRRYYECIGQSVQSDYSGLPERTDDC